MLLLGDRGAGNNKNSSNQKANSNPSTLRRSSSTNRKQVSIRARYWAYLFDNLRRAVDEIYATCDTDSSVVECKVIEVYWLFISIITKEARVGLFHRTFEFYRIIPSLGIRVLKFEMGFCFFFSEGT